MSNNLSYHGKMKADDLEIGQLLVNVSHYGFSRTTHAETLYSVVKKTKTRLVVRRQKAVEGALVPAKGELRVIVKDGLVTSKVEGWGDRNSLDLHTPDDEMLPRYRAETNRTELRSAAGKAAERAYRRLDTDTAAEAVAALQAWLDSIEDEA